MPKAGWPATWMLALVIPGAATARAGTEADFYATRPLFERPFPAQRVPVGLKSLSARECGGCHVAVYREWQQSVHAQAWVDPQFQGEMRKQPGVAWLCVNCHTPLVNQLDSLVTGLEGGDVERPVKRVNPGFVRALQEEAITCAACHVRDGAVEGPFRDVRAPHATRYSAEFRSPALCLRCHQAVQSYPGKNFICTFQTGEEWQAGPWAARGAPCQDCHMPPATRPLAPGGPARRTASHGWIGSHLKKGREAAPALWDSLAARLPPGVELRPDPAPRAAPGAAATWRVRVVNSHAGHRLPTGDPEREVRVELAALSAAGDPLARSELVIAQRYQWYPVVRKLSDNRLAPGGATTATLRFRMPHGAYRLVARALNVRISDANADYHHLPAWYPRRAEVARVALDVPGRQQPSRSRP
ncbi:MAG: hypothetical protein HZC42_14705 [Candidatus Eisenbacteria bacterium]|nr:hypothetical protein [Candidatus Eisenbacteria bacterium]